MFRRDRRRGAGLGTAAKAFAAVRIVDDGLHLASPYFDIRLSLGQPGFAALVFDGLGEAKPGPNALRPPAGNDVYRATRGVQDGGAWVEYRRAGHGGRGAARAGDLRSATANSVSFRSGRAAEKPRPLLLNFDAERCHVTLLGLMNDDGTVRLPAVLAPPQSRLAAHHDDRQAAGRCWATTPIAASRGFGRTQLRQGHVSRRHPVAAADRVSLRGHGDLSAAGQARKGPGAARLPSQLAEHPPIEPAVAHAGQQFDQRRLRGLHV